MLGYWSVSQRNILGIPCSAVDEVDAEMCSFLIGESNLDGEVFVGRRWGVWKDATSLQTSNDRTILVADFMVRSDNSCAFLYCCQPAVDATPVDRLLL